MGERKVLNKYYPPDFDPAKIPRRRQLKNQQMKVRMMLPMSIRCATCGNYIYKGTKFNSRKEDVVGEPSTFFSCCHVGDYEDIPKKDETYLGIQIFRFYFKCTRCSAELTMKTDPQNSDYVVEAGATRNFEPWRAEDEEADSEKLKREKEEMGDAMKSLENRTLDSKREMDILAALDEVKSMKSRQATVSVDAMLEALQRSAEDKEKKLEEEDEALIKSLFGGPRREIIQRIADDVFDEDDDEDLSQTLSENGETSSNQLKKRRKVSEEPARNPTDCLAKTSDSSKNEEKQGASLAPKHIFKSSLVRVSVVRKPSSASNSNGPAHQASKPTEEHKTNATSTGLLSLCQNYESDEDD
ncbi:uncharacterized protein LOC131329488 isoform X1 [Rhododendron vialii]|uniref:uncharacterized protein LOC131329488 isoform X1 n=1 Tax=Rhododendron vialii TaxID=182163 RepID=UPI00265EF34C|nr:uncharacterized protein LOC131329488 isoform X1 [Rhododendron vialii]